MQYRFGLPNPQDPKARNAQNAGDHATNYTEQTVSQKPEGKFRLYRILMAAAYVVYALTFFIICTEVKLPMLIALLPVTTWILVFFTWRYVSVEYEYFLGNGILTFTKVYGGRTRRVLFALPIRDMETVAPLADSAEAVKKAAAVLDLRGSEKAPGAYCFTAKDADGNTVAVLFSATEKALKILKYYNGATVVSSL